MPAYDEEKPPRPGLLRCVAWAIRPDRRHRREMALLASEALLERVEPLAGAVVLRAAGTHGRQHAFGGVQERRGGDAALKRDEGATRTLFCPRFPLSGVNSPVVMSTTPTAPALAGFLATVQSHAFAGTAIASAKAATPSPASRACKALDSLLRG
jgi:hypothetical protein